MNSGKTAIRRGKPSRPLKLFLSELPSLWPDGLPIDVNVFDLGCGRQDDIEHMKAYFGAGSNVDGYDPNHKPEPTPASIDSGSKDIVTCFFVLNTVDDREARIDILKDALSLVSSDGLVAVATRSPRNVRNAVRDGWNRYGDGWVTKSGTFQRGIGAPELAEMMVEVGFEIVIVIADNSEYSMVVGIELLLEYLEV